MLVPARGHIRNLSQDSNINKKGEWSFAKKLALLWGGAVAAIGLILYLDFNTHGKYVDAEEIKRKQQRMQGEEGGVMRYIISMPCMRTTLMLMMVGGLTSWVVTFLLTSNPRRAFIMLCNSPVVLGSLFFAFCSYETAGDQADVAEFQSALDGIRKKHTLHEDKPPQSSDETEK
ncbi:hypothetical protein EB796_018349 [Bugula neritina]|uniref:Uncharacterized protein n=1 Tax=Bugula neritina TaxID=10212 RepID=A0A7J7JBB3_BUGNE|nr:hypothetical protein EB796_018349 [Bugula neritina]